MTYAQWVAGFWKRVLKRNPSQCWLWTGTLVGGYGQLKRPDGTNVYAHRASVEIRHKRRIPADAIVMHSCDNPRCVNPWHLKLATQSENIQDMHNKGRGCTNVLRGDSHGSTKISDADVQKIRKLWANRRNQSVTQTGLAAKFGVTQAQISRIVNGKRRA